MDLGSIAESKIGHLAKPAGEIEQKQLVYGISIDLQITSLLNPQCDNQAGEALKQIELMP